MTKDSGFTAELSRRILVELKGMKDLIDFRDSRDWQKEAPKTSPDEFLWMTNYQAAPHSTRQRWRRHRTSNVSQLSGAGGARISTGSSVRVDSLYAGIGGLYTTGSDEGSQRKGPAGCTSDAGTSDAKVDIAAAAAEGESKSHRSDKKLISRRDNKTVEMQKLSIDTSRDGGTHGEDVVNPLHGVAGRKVAASGEKL